jgi:hypothetical protein
MNAPCIQDAIEKTPHLKNSLRSDDSKEYASLKITCRVRLAEQLSSLME